jgi:hypothetical protein
MADYHSLLSRAVANLPSASSQATRQAIYDRARKALLTQLRTLRPPLPESDIAREESALDVAIALVEARFVQPDAPQEPPSPATAPPAAAGPPSQGPAAARPAVSAPAAPKPPPPAPAHVAPLSATSLAAPAKSHPAAPPGAPLKPSTAAAKPAAAAAAQSPPVASARGPVQPPAPAALGAQGAASPKPPLGPAAAQPAGGPKSAVAPAVGARGESSLAAAPENLASVVPAASPDVAAASGAPPVVASRSEGALELAGAPEVPSDVDRVASSARPDSEGQRPIAPGVVPGRLTSWPWLALAIVVGVVLSVAIVAIVMRQKPQDLAINPPAEPPEDVAPQPPAKIAERVQAAPVNPSSPPAASSEPQGDHSAAPGEGPGGAAVEAQNSASPPPVAARAAMLVASADDPQKPVVNLGSTVWSTIPPAPGQPATVAVKADADIPDLKMHATMTLRKNTDPTLQATHTIDLKFSFADGAPVTGFKDVGLPQMRKLDSTASETLTSVKVKISDAYFLIALAKGEQDITRNLELMQTRAWFDFPLLLNDNRIAKIVFQKSPEGEAMLAKAFEAWK